MEVVYPVCCGLDVHKRLLVACLLRTGPEGKPVSRVRKFGTTTGDILALRDWLLREGCPVVAMESTGPFWKPVWNLLEGDALELVLVNPAHIKAYADRKTDAKDSEWIAQLLRHGLLRASFVPDRAQRELRELTRYRAKLIGERASEANRIQKVLEGANIKLASVVTDILGVSARAMIEALCAGSRDPAALAELARGRLRDKKPELVKALEGRFGPMQGFLLTEQLAHIDELDAHIAALDARIAEATGPFRAAIDRLLTIPGVGRRAAEVIVAELGVDMGRFPTADQAASWAGVAPGNHESAGKRLADVRKPGNKALERVLVEAAWASTRTRTYLAAQYRRLARTRGPKRAAVAVAHSILVVAYHLLKEGTTYEDLGPRYFEERSAEARQRWLIRQLEAYDLDVTVTPKPEAA
jgi:transposase